MIFHFNDTGYLEGKTKQDSVEKADLNNYLKEIEELTKANKEKEVLIEYIDFENVNIKEKIAKL